MDKQLLRRDPSSAEDSIFSRLNLRFVFSLISSLVLLFLVSLVLLNLPPFDFLTINLRSLTRDLNLSESNLSSSSSSSSVGVGLPPRQFDIVLSSYHEDLFFVGRFISYLRNVSTLHRVDPRVIVDKKNASIPISHLKEVLLADLVLLLPNVGREGGTSLTQIVNNYFTLSSDILFSQAGVEGITSIGLSPWFSDRLINQFHPNTGDMPLVEDRWISNYDCGYHSNAGHQPRLPELWAMLEHSLCPPGGQAVNFRGQFLVSGRRIRSRPYSVYKYLNDLITANSSHWIHRYQLSGGVKSTPDNPFFGHTVERLWAVLFNCSKSDLMEKCRHGSCFCLDD